MREGNQDGGARPRQSSFIVLSTLILCAAAGCLSPPLANDATKSSTDGGQVTASPSVSWTVDLASNQKEIFTSIVHVPATLTITAPAQRHFAHANVIGMGKSFSGLLKVTFGGWADDVLKTISLTGSDSVNVPIDPSWRPAIGAITAKTPVTLTVTLADSETGRVVYADSQPYQLLPLTYFAWYVDTHSSDVLAPVFITPNAAFVRQVLADAAPRTPWGSIVGYQEVSGYTHEQVVQYQTKAVWEILQRRGFTYVNAPETYSSSAAQNIKYPASTYDDKTGNCIESVLLMASIFEAIGFHTDILLPTGHAFLGVDQWSDTKIMTMLETTMLPSSSWSDAFDVAGQEWDQHHLDSSFRFIDVNKMRGYGIGPNPWAPAGNPDSTPKAPKYTVQNQAVTIPAGTDYHYAFSLQTSMDVAFAWTRGDNGVVSTGYMAQSSLSSYEAGATVTVYAWHHNVGSISDHVELQPGYWDYVINCENSVADCQGTFSLST